MRLGQADGWGEVAAGAWANPVTESVLAATPTAVKEVEKSGAGFIGASDALVLILAVCSWTYVLSLKGVPLLPPTPPATAVFALAAMGVASSHVLYSIIWYKSKAFKKVSKKMPLSLLGAKPVAVFEKLVLGSKLFQQFSLISWACSGDYAALFASLTSLDTPQYVVGAALLLIGQLLNMSIYRAIGKNGVYCAPT